MDKAPRIAVILSNYNDSRFILSCLLAVIEQKPDEIIFVDDASTDKSVEIVESISKYHPGIKIIRNHKNLGVQKSFIRGCIETTCEYVLGVSMDDMPINGHINKMKIAISAFQSVDIFLCSSKVIREGREYERILFQNDSYVSPEYLSRIIKNGYSRQLNLAGSVCKKSTIMKCWEQVGEKIDTNFDALYNFYPMFDKGFIYLSDCLYLYRSFSNSLGNTGKTEKILIANRLQDEFMKKELSKENYKLLKESGILSTKSTFIIQIAIFLVNKAPKIIREMVYKWFYSYNWRIEKI